MEFRSSGKLPFRPPASRKEKATGDLLEASLASKEDSPALIRRLLAESLVLAEDWAALPHPRQEQISQCSDAGQVLEQLVEEGLLTSYQAARIQAGKHFGLILGNYRVLERLGAGGMGVVFKAEHRRMRRLVAIKVVVQPNSSDQAADEEFLLRFFSETRAVAQLQHPHIVSAIDAGEEVSTDPDQPVLYYFVMEYVPGKDLEEYVNEKGPLPPAKACELIYQIASALTEAHEHNLVHRDIKPSNILVTQEEQAKLLDFGLAQHFRHRMTVPGTVLGTLEYMAPEQARDASRVDHRADIYGLGGTLYWCLTGQPPFPPSASINSDLLARLSKSAPSVRTVRMDVPPELDAVVARMMARNPDDRYSSAKAVMRALLRFVDQNSRYQRPRSTRHLTAGTTLEVSASPTAVPSALRTSKMLLVEADPALVSWCQDVLQGINVACVTVNSVANALDKLAASSFDLILLDLDLPDLANQELLLKLRSASGAGRIVVCAQQHAADDLASLLPELADDYLTKPFRPTQLLARIKALLHGKEVQDRIELLNQHLLATNGELERTLTARDADLARARNTLILGLAQVVEKRQAETAAHRIRMQRYCRCLAEEAAQVASFLNAIDQNFILLLEATVALHDIGMVALPDHILLKPGKLTPEERILMQEHTVQGAELLQELAKQQGFAGDFWKMAIDIARHHHERFDGSGYPDALSGSVIPLPARLVALADVYDALRSRRTYKPALSHGAAMQLMTVAIKGQFDPALIPILQRCASRWEAIFRETID